MKSFMPSSTKDVEVQCQNCSNKRTIKIRDLIVRHRCCPICGDGIPYPEKFMYSLLTQLKVKFQTKVTFEWAKYLNPLDKKVSGNKEYDFYLPNYNCIIETHGEQHYIDNNWKRYGGRTFAEEQENDLAKEKLARDNKIDNYVVIDCRESNKNWIKQHIMESSLPHLLCFTEHDIDWGQCNFNGLSSNVKKASELWNQGYRTIEISNIMLYSQRSVIRWLKTGNNCGLCNYSAEESEKRRRDFFDRKKIK
nr:MAG TPA: restriction enzyme [Herelleviridae sp.]